jgi:HAD superfamily hydrolase (TIGR01490 family)
MPAAVFDVDRTLVDGMTGFLFSRHLLRRAGLSPWAKFRIAWAIGRYRARLAPEEAIVEIGVTVYAGKRADDLDRWAADCVREEIAGRCYSEATDRVARHRAAGDHVLLASGSSDFVVRALAAHVGAHGAVATRAEVLRGRSTRRIAYPLCYLEGKLALVERYLAQRGLSLGEATVYTDNLADLSLLERVARPVVVNPAAKLEAVARARGWEIERWTTPADAGRSFTGTSFPLR